ncbi:unnamed protein product [Trifolium pratense]|uniref:Uncharacterized protein n=1 Tax=Trifolium pratense TaxID=57577 RepID=A0ACB0KJ18_TRIPR|nr:unnamed protein product [Trifolium pratense]
MRKILQVIELRVSNQAESKESQNHIFKAHEGKYQTEINALENLVVGTTEGNELTPAALCNCKILFLVRREMVDSTMETLDSKPLSPLTTTDCKPQISSPLPCSMFAVGLHFYLSFSDTFHSPMYNKNQINQ